jgi:H+/Cl- antiporter ClcA
MNQAIFFLGTLIGLLFGAVGHLFFNGGIRTLAAYLILGVVGFWAGHFAGVLWGIFSFGRIGKLYLLNGILMSVLFILLGYVAKKNINMIEE